MKENNNKGGDKERGMNTCAARHHSKVQIRI